MSRETRTAATAYPRSLVCLDVDGTILTHGGDLREDVRAAIREVADAGHHVTIATGRSLVATMPVLRMLGITSGYAVCSNGAVTLRVDPGREKGYKIVEKVSLLKVGALLVNLAILAYLVWAKRLFGVRGGLAGLDRELAEDVDWETLHRQAPVP